MLNEGDKSALVNFASVALATDTRIDPAVVGLIMPNVSVVDLTETLHAAFPSLPAIAISSGGRQGGMALSAELLKLVPADREAPNAVCCVSLGEHARPVLDWASATGQAPEAQLTPVDRSRPISPSGMAASQASRKTQMTAVSLMESSSRAIQSECEDCLCARKESIFEIHFKGAAECLFYVTIGADGCFRYEEINSAALNQTGKTLEQVRGMTPEQVFGPDIGGRISKALREAYESGRPHRYEPTYRMHLGEKNFDATYSPVRGSSGRIIGILGSAHDVTGMRQIMLQKDALAVQARTDGLTGLANRRHFDEVFEIEWRRSRRVASSLSLLMIDVDRFKLYNDRYGHPHGDVCLKIISDIVGHVGRRPLDLVARYGGEEIVVLLPETDETGARELGERIRGAIENEMIEHLDNVPWRVATVSIGVATQSPAVTGDATTERLLSRADHALYRAKQCGRNRVIVDE